MERTHKSDVGGSKFRLLRTSSSADEKDERLKRRRTARILLLFSFGGGSNSIECLSTEVLMLSLVGERAFVLHV